MKNAIILALLLTIAWLVLSRSDSPQALIQDVSKPSADSAPVADPAADQVAADPDEEIV